MYWDAKLYEALVHEKFSKIEVKSVCNDEITVVSGILYPNSFTVTGTVTGTFGSTLEVRTEALGLITETRKELKEEVKKMKTYAYIRFIGKDGKFHENTKLYTYEIDNIIENFMVGTVIKIKELNDNLIPRYSDTPVRVEGIIKENELPNKNKITNFFLVNQSFYKEFAKDIVSSYDEVLCEIFYSHPSYPNHIICDFEDLENYYYNTWCISYGIQTYNTKEEDIKLINNCCITATSTSGNIDSTYTSSSYNYNYNGLNTSTAIPSTIAGSYEPIEDFINRKVEECLNNKNKMEETKMNSIFNNIFDNVTFGKLTTTKIKYSISGIAFADNNGKFFVYTDGKATDVTGMTIDVPIFAIPVATNQVKVNDIIYFKKNYVIVKEIVAEGLKVVNPWEGDIKTIIPETNIFNFNYYTKIINIFETVGNTANEANPFGNLLPLMMFTDINKGNDGDMLKFIMLSQMTGGTINFNNMLPFFLMNKDGDKNMDFLMMMMFMRPDGIIPTSFPSVSIDKIRE